jgi:hypothetical protein
MLFPDLQSVSAAGGQEVSHTQVQPEKHVGHKRRMCKAHIGFRCGFYHVVSFHGSCINGFMAFACVVALL